MKTSISSYLKYCLERLDLNLNRSDLDHRVKSDIESKIKAIDDLIESINFQEKSTLEKQTIRIEWLASYIKRGKDVSQKRATLELYDAINSFLPYLKVVNRHGVHNDFEILLHKELELIDFGFLNYGDIHVSERDFNLLSEKFFHSTEGEILAYEIQIKLEQLKHAFKKVYN